MHRVALCLLFTVSTACSSINAGHPPATGTAAAACTGAIVLHDTELQAYRGCRTISGDLTLYGVTSLSPLASVRHVKGKLTIEHTGQLYTLAGLEQLQSVDRLEIRHNSALVSASALRNLKHVGQASVTHNPRLSSKYGFLDGMERAGAEVDLAHNSGLVAEGMGESISDKALAAR